VSTKPDGKFSEIEQSQSILRESIETAKSMVDRSDELLKRYRSQAAGGSTEQPA
jgi:hypothetical protein